MSSVATSQEANVATVGSFESIGILGISHSVNRKYRWLRARDLHLSILVVLHG